MKILKIFMLILVTFLIPSIAGILITVIFNDESWNRLLMYWGGMIFMLGYLRITTKVNR